MDAGLSNTYHQGGRGGGESSFGHQAVEKERYLNIYKFTPAFLHNHLCVCVCVCALEGFTGK